MKIITVFILSYLLGSIPTGYIFAKWFKGVDVRKIGSGNVGATNVSRIMGLKYGVIVAVMDILKGYVAVMLARYLLSGMSIYIIFAAALLAIVGHDRSVFLKFSGGKGVATTAGVILCLVPLAFFIFFIIWLLIVFLTRYVSLASMIGILSIPLTTYYYYNVDYTVFAFIIALSVIYTHRGNIKRLIKGTENRMSWPPGEKGAKE